MKKLKEKQKILVIDDHQTNVLLMRKILEKQNYEVYSFVSCENIINKVIKLFPNLILLDIMMPNVDGIEFLQMLKNAEETKIIPVVIVSAKTDTNVVDKALELGAVDFIKKPVSIVYLLNAVEKILHKNTH